MEIEYMGRKIRLDTNDDVQNFIGEMAGALTRVSTNLLMVGRDSLRHGQLITSISEWLRQNWSTNNGQNGNLMTMLGPLAAALVLKPRAASTSPGTPPAPTPSTSVAADPHKDPANLPVVIGSNGVVAQLSSEPKPTHRAFQMTMTNVSLPNCVGEPGSAELCIVNLTPPYATVPNVHVTCLGDRGGVHITVGELMAGSFKLFGCGTPHNTLALAISTFPTADDPTF